SRVRFLLSSPGLRGSERPLAPFRRLPRIIFRQCRKHVDRRAIGVGKITRYEVNRRVPNRPQEMDVARQSPQSGDDERRIPLLRVGKGVLQLTALRAFSLLLVPIRADDLSSFVADVILDALNLLAKVVAVTYPVISHESAAHPCPPFHKILPPGQ